MKNSKNKGFMMVEIMVATSIIVVSILAVMSVTQKSIYVSRQALHTSQTAFLLEEGAEAVRVFRDNAWSNISGLATNTNYYPKFSGGTWILTTTPSDGTVGIFTRSITIASVNRDNTTQDISSSGTNDPGTKLITITVSWSESGTTITETLPFYISNIFSS